MVLDIPELLEEVLKRVTDPRAFASALRVNREWHRIAKSLVPRKKQEFLRTRNYYDSDGFRHEVTIYPNKAKHGKEEIYDGALLRTVRWWHEGQLHGTEYEYDDLGATVREIPWVQGKRHGRQVRYYPQGKVAYKYWDRGKPVSKEVYDHTQQLQTRDEYSSEKTFVHYERDNNTGNLARMGVYVNKEKHGLYREQGRDVLYIHGVKQLWYTTDRWEMVLYGGLALFLGIVIVWCYRRRSLAPALSYYYLVFFALVVIVIPLSWGIWRGGRILFLSA